MGGDVSPLTVCFPSHHTRFTHSRQNTTRIRKTLLCELLTIMSASSGNDTADSGADFKLFMASPCTAKDGTRNET